MPHLRDRASFRRLPAAVALAMALAAPAFADGAVTLSIVDRVGREIPSGFVLKRPDGGPVAAAGDGPGAAVAAGPWRMIPDASPRLAREITVVEGEKLPVRIKAPDGLWLGFVRRNGPPEWVLVFPKPATAMATALAAFDLSRGDEEGLLAVSRPGVPAATQAAALALARSSYGAPMQDRTAAGYARWDRAHVWAGRILAAAGDASDVERLAAEPRPHDVYDDLAIAAQIERRLGRIGQGRLVELANGKATRAAAAATLLHQAGIARGDERLAELLQAPEAGSSHVWYRAWLAALPLRSAQVEAAFAAEVKRLLARDAEIAALPGEARQKATNEHRVMLLPLVLRAMASGNDDQLEQLTSRPVDAAAELAPLVRNPEALARFAMADYADDDFVGLRIVANLCALAGGAEDPVLRALDAAAREAGAKAAQARNNLAPAVARALPEQFATVLAIMASHCRPAAPAAAWLTDQSDLPLTSWIPQPWRFDDLIGYLANHKWEEEFYWGRLDLWLETVPPERIEAALEAKGPAGNAYPLDLYRAYRRVATRANFLYPRAEEAGSLAAMRREPGGRPYVIADKRHDGGVAGIAELRVETAASATRFRIRLEQRPYYRPVGLFGTQGDRSEWKFHPYTLERGRKLIQGVRLMRADQAVELKEVAPGEGDSATFEAARIEDWSQLVLALDLALFDDRRQLLFELYAPPPGP